jgi:hypothetical protein
VSGRRSQPFAAKAQGCDGQPVKQESGKLQIIDLQFLMMRQFAQFA